MALGEKLRAAGHPPVLVSAALTQSRLRTAARAKFGPFAAGMLFTPAGPGAGDPAAGRGPARAAVHLRRGRAGRRPRVRDRVRRDGARHLRPRGARGRARRAHGRRRHHEPAALAGGDRPLRGRHDHGPDRLRRRLRRPRPAPDGRVGVGQAAARPAGGVSAAVVRARPGTPAAGGRPQDRPRDPAPPRARGRGGAVDLRCGRRRRGRALVRPARPGRRPARRARPPGRRRRERPAGRGDRRGPDRPGGRRRRRRCSTSRTAP